MIGGKVLLKKAEEIKKKLTEKKVIDNNFKFFKDKSHIYFPLKKKVKIVGLTIVDRDFSEKKKKTGSLKELLKSKLSKEEISKLKTAYDVVGTIAILEIDEELRKKEKDIAKALLDSNKSIKTVLRKDAGHEGNFRTQKMKFLAGKNTRETIHKENNVIIKLDVEKVYFSARLSTERKRIAAQIKKGELVLVMFSGCGPFTCVISKNTSAKEVVSVEINPEGHKYAVENAKINKLKNVILINGDVKYDVPLLAKKGIKFDRIVMPAPHNAGDFLNEALLVAKKGTVIHYYDFQHEDDFSEVERKVVDACSKAGLKYKKIGFVKCGQHAPRAYRVCLDFQVL